MNGSDAAVAAPLRLKPNILHRGFLYRTYNLGLFHKSTGRFLYSFCTLN